MISLGLTGFPLGHSLSPCIHQAALAYCGLEGKYTLYPVPPDDGQALQVLIGRIRTGEITGLNVTIPHKQRVISMLDVLTPAAETIGAVNTIYRKDGILTGDNTDSSGFLNDLQELLAEADEARTMKKSALVLGAGGAARAVVYALLKDEWKVTIAARRSRQAEGLISQFPAFRSMLAVVDFSAEGIRKVMDGVTLIVNATPLGMSPDIGQNPWPQDVSLPDSAVCYDLVYNPHETFFVRQARAAGHIADTGLGMLLRQAELAFKIWTGCSVPLEHLTAAVEAA